MLRWIFLLIVVANIFPGFFSTNRERADSDLRADSGVGIDQGNYNPIRFVSERSEDDFIDSLAGGESEENVLPQRRELRCFLLGPLASITVSENYAQQLESAGLMVERRWREVEVGSDYWVYLPKQLSSRATARTLQELKANDVEGFIFSDGELRSSIALGAYTDRSLAESKQKQFSELGYEPKIHKMARLAREYWVLSSEIPRPGIIEELMNRAEVSEIPQKISRMGCQTVANAMHFQ